MHDNKNVTHMTSTSVQTTISWLKGILPRQTKKTWKDFLYMNTEQRTPTTTTMTEQ